jgi:Secretion system C-terminal sorting domain
MKKVLLIIASCLAFVFANSQKTAYDSFALPINVKPGAKILKGAVIDLSPLRLVTCQLPDVRIFPSNTPQSEIHLSINKVDNQSLLVSSNTFPIGNSFQGAYWSQNAGASWAGNDVLPNNSFGRGDPSTAYDALGRGYIATMGPNAVSAPTGLLVTRTDNNGTTWQPQVNATGIINGFDKDMIAADDVPTSPFANNLYATWSVFAATNTVQFNRSTNGGQTFSVALTLRNGYGQGANVQTGPNGEVYVCWADYTNGSIPAQGLGFARSLNGGVSFAAATVPFPYAGIRTSTAASADFGGTRINDFPSMSVDKSNGPRRGRIYVVYPERENGNGRSIIRIRWSDNQGTNWSAPTTISIATARQSWMPWVSVDATTGNVFVSYFCMQNANTFATSTVVAASVNGFANFQNQVVSDVDHITAPIPQFGGGYAGDYIGMTAHGGRGFAGWMDDRSGVWQNYVSEVRVADVQLTGAAQFCTSATYTLTGVPAGATIVWQTPPPTLVTMTTNNNTANLTRQPNTNGQLTLTAEVIDGGCTYGLFSIDVFVGSPNNLVGTYSTATATKPLQTVNFVPSGNIYTQYQWQNVTGNTATLASGSPSGTGFFAFGNVFQFNIASFQTVTVNLNGNGLCGPVNATRTFVQSSFSSFALKASPNPASNVINVGISKTVDSTSLTPQLTTSSTNTMGVTKMYLYDLNTNILVRQWSFAESNSQSYNLSVIGLKTGYYVLKMERDNQTTTTKILVK